jgi:tripartite-type tricarboxylate transporter receptor subunit TctC
VVGARDHFELAWRPVQPELLVLTRRRLIALAVAVAAAAAAVAPGMTSRAAGAQASDWPSRFVRLICPLAPGGGIDATARVLAARLSEVWGQQVVVENRPGAASNIAAELVARADPDGHTLYIATFPHTTNRFMYPSLGFDPVADFAPVTLIGLYPNIMVVPMSSPAHSVAEFIAHAKANPGKLSYASSGHGTSLHLAGELFKRRAGVDLVHVPYRGAGPAFNDIIPGRIDAMFNFTASSLPLVRNGQLRALAVTMAKRVPAAPEVPTMAEAGVAGVEVNSWSAFYVPARTPAEIIRKIRADTVAVLVEPAIRANLEKGGVIVVGSTPEELAGFLKSEMEKWGPIIKDAGITIRN